MAHRKRSSAKWKFIANVILATAAVTLLYPLLTDFYAWYQQSQMVRVYQDTQSKKTITGLAAAPETSDSGLDPEMVWGILEIPDIGVNTPVIKGTAPNNLALAPGWYTSSALPGYGNTAIAGHRTMYGGPFRHLSQLRPGAEIILRYALHRYRYQVEEVRIIDSSDWSVIDDCGYPALTLTTCTPDGQNRRLAVRARLIPDKTLPE